MGYDIGFSGSSSSGANLGGATDISAGGNYGGTGYGPGSVVSGGASAPIWPWIIAGLIALGGVAVLAYAFLKGGK